MLNYKQAKDMFNSFLPKPPVSPLMPHIYSHIVENQDKKSFHAGFVLLWHKKVINDEVTCDAIRTLGYGYEHKLVKYITLG